MATIKYEDSVVQVAEDWRLGELIEAENALGVDMETAKSSAKMALVIYISLRRVRKELPIDALANIVRHMEITSLIGDDEETEAGPLEEGSGSSGQASATGEQQTSGRLRSAS